VEKNWTPFLFNDSIVLLSYALFPHIVCQNDVDLGECGKYTGCVICYRKYASYNTKLMLESEALYRLAVLHTYQDAYVLSCHFHLNGVGAHKVVNGAFYIGIGHAVVKSIISGASSKRRRVYLHFFYKMSVEPPFEIMDMSCPIPLRLKKSRAPWFSSGEEIAHVSFVNGFDYDPEIIDEEFMISYGEGDHIGRVMFLSVDRVASFFNEGVSFGCIADALTFG